MSNNQTDTAAELGFKHGTKAHQAATLYLRVDGATDADIRKSCGGPQRNLLARVKKQGHTVIYEKIEGPKGRTVTRYKIELKK